MSKECKKCRNSVAEVPRRGRCYCPDPDDNSKCMLFKPMTNGDRIRAMTDEELAKAAANHIPLHSWPDAVRDIYFSRHVSKYGAWLEWLKQPVKEGAE